MNDLVKQFYNTSICGLWAFVDHKSKLIHITLTSNIGVSIARTIAKIKEDDYSIKDIDLETIEIVILETYSEYDYLCKLRYGYWVDQYRSLGYTLWVKRRLPLRYKSVKVKIENVDGVYKSVVRLYNARNESILLGVFDTIEESEEFARFVLTNHSVGLRPVYAINELSKNCFRRNDEVVYTDV